MIPAAFSTAHAGQAIQSEFSAGPAEPLLERERVSMSMEPTQVMTLGDPSRQGSAPHVAWLDSRWQVYWTSPGIALDDSAVEPFLYAASVSPDGEVERRATSFSMRTFDTLQPGPDGTFALLRPAQMLGSQLQPCEIAVTDTVASQSHPAFRFSCGGEFAATAIQGSEDWLVFFSPPEEGQRGQASDSVWLARYRPSEQGWVAGPWKLFSGDLPGALAVSTMREDAVVIWHATSRTQLARIQGVAGTTPSAPHQPERLEAFYTAEEPLYALTETEQGTLLLWPDVEAGLVGSSIRGDGGASSLGSVASTSVVDRTPGVAPIPERALVAVCYATRERPGSGDGDAVSLAIVDEDGVIVGTPSVVARSMENVGGCDLAWSGSALLLAWWEIDNDTPRVSPPSSIVRARIVALP
jgi:hypothetical protein